MNDLKYTLPKIDPASNIQSTSKEEKMKNTDDGEKPNAEIDDEGFKILEGTAHHNKKKLKADECRKIVDCILDRELDQSGILVDKVIVQENYFNFGLNIKQFFFHHNAFIYRRVTY